MRDIILEAEMPQTLKAMRQAFAGEYSRKGPAMAGLAAMYRWSGTALPTASSSSSAGSGSTPITGSKRKQYSGR